MTEWPVVGDKVTFKRTHMFWFKDMIENAEKLLEVGKEYTISKIRVNSSWVSVVLDEFPENKFPLSFFTYNKDKPAGYTEEDLLTRKDIHPACKT
jgi:hypothetical protein